MRRPREGLPAGRASLPGEGPRTGSGDVSRGGAERRSGRGSAGDIRRRGRGAALAWLGAAAGALAPAPARAQAVDLTARTVYHGFQLQLDPNGRSDALRDLHRFYATVEGGAYQLGPERQFDLVASLRYDTDFGRGFSIFTPFGGSLPAVDGRNDADVLFLYLDWRDVIDRTLDVRVGRQLQLDDLDWYVVDGLKLMGHLWQDGENRLDVDVYAGLPVRFDTLFASSEALLGDGTEVYDGEDPFGGAAIGGTAYLRLFRDLSASVSWRNELVFRDTEIVGFGPATRVSVLVDGDRIGDPWGMLSGGLSDPAQRRALGADASEGKIGLQESLVGGSLGYVLRPLDLTFQGTLVFDLVVSDLDRARASLAWDPARNLHFGAEYLRIRPRFVGDSIFNWFNIFPYDRGRVEASWSPFDERLTLEASYFLQAFSGSEVSGARFAGEDVSHGPGGGVSWRDGWYGLGAYAEGATNFGGNYAYGGNYSNAWLTGDVSFFGGRLATDARVAVTTVQEDRVAGIDEGRVDRARTAWTIGLGVRGEITEWLRARAFYAQNIDPVLEGNYRLFTELMVVYR